MSSPFSQKKSYLQPHPQITKKLQSPSTDKIPKVQIPQKQYKRIYNDLINKQHIYSVELKQKISTLQNQNQIFEQSLEFYSPDVGFEQYQQELQAIKEQDARITQMIQNCQVIQANTSPQEYFLFKKNKRLQSFNEAMDQLFEEVNKQKQQMKKFLQQIKSQSKQIKNQILQIENKLNKSTIIQKVEEINQQNSSDQDRPQQSKVNFTVQSNSQSSLSNRKKQIQHVESDSGSSVDYEQLNQLKQNYKNLLQTYEILSQNKEILTTQLFNNIESIEESLSTYFQTQKTKLFRDITQIKQDFESMPLDQVNPPNDSQLKYQISPLIHDYNNRFVQIGKKLPSDLKNIATQIITPFKWQSVNLQSYLQPSTNLNKSRRSTVMSNTKSMMQETKQHEKAQKEYEKLEKLLQKQNQQIQNLQYTLQQVMGETMKITQNHHQLQLAINNMKKMLREQKG